MLALSARSANEVPSTEAEPRVSEAAPRSFPGPAKLSDHCLSVWSEQTKAASVDSRLKAASDDSRLKAIGRLQLGQDGANVLVDRA
jgi:hypothetical protein